MSEIYSLDQGSARRGNRWSLTARDMDRALFGIEVPSAKMLLRIYYGPSWARELSRQHGTSVRMVYACTSGEKSLPRFFLQAALDDWNDPARRKAWERARRADLERQLNREIERRAAVGRWLNLLLSGAVALRDGLRWRKYGYEGVERNFLGKDDL